MPSSADGAAGGGAFIGGAAVAGGVGTVVGAIVGGLITAVMSNGLFDDPQAAAELLASTSTAEAAMPDVGQRSKHSAGSAWVYSYGPRSAGEA